MCFMFICICNSVTDQDIYQAVQQGASSLEDLSSQLSLGSRCGCCKEEARQYLHHFKAIDRLVIPAANQPTLSSQASSVSRMKYQRKRTALWQVAA